LKSQKYGKTEMFQNSSVGLVISDLYFILSIGIPYNQEGCNIGSLTWSKVLIGYPSENPEGKPCKTNSKILG